MRRPIAVLIAICIAVTAGYLAFRETKTTPVAPPPAWVAGWADLGDCGGTTSFDGKRWLVLHSDGQAEVTGDVTMAGRWVLRDGLYRVTFAGEALDYSRIELDGIVCMLVKGPTNAADLRGSWYSTAPQQPAPGPDDY